MEQNYNMVQQQAPAPHWKQGYGQQTIIIEHKSNGLGTAGFVFALIALFIGWIPLFGWLLWALGALFSFIGLFKAPRGLAIAGFIISFIDFFLLLFLGTAITALIGMGAL